MADKVFPDPPPRAMAGKVFPDPPPEALPWLEGAREGRLLLQRCRACGRWQFYPRHTCLACGGADLEWAEASGRGRVHTFTVIHQNRAPGWSEEVPYVVAVIDLEEGARMTSNVVGCDPASVQVGMPVEAVFVDEGTFVLPKFRPAARGP